MGAKRYEVSQPSAPTVTAPAPNGNGAAKESIFDLFLTDADCEQEGVWLTHPTSGKKFRIAAAENPRHMAVLDSLGEARLRSLENQELSPDERRKERARIAAYGLLRDWDESFAEPFSPEVAIDLLSQDRAGSRHLLNWIFGRALEYQHFLVRGRERDSKN